jgi:serine/threonine protein phosphatase 1
LVGLKALFHSFLRALGVSKKGAANKPSKMIESSDFAALSGPEWAYAIGDIHGMGQLLKLLLIELSADYASHKFTTYIIFLGDFIDRGPESREIIQTLVEIESASKSLLRPVFLKGNHEQMLLDFIQDPAKHGEFWIKNGGDKTLSSYGVFCQNKPNAKQLIYLRDELVSRMPDDHIKMLRSLKSSFVLGDYFFCHAGIRIGLALSQQTDEFLLWTRNQPNAENGPQEKIIVHGHQPVNEPLIAQFHINVDTGAFATGRLTALKLHGGSRSIISVCSKVSHDNRTISKRQV